MASEVEETLKRLVGHKVNELLPYELNLKLPEFSGGT